MSREMSVALISLLILLSLPLQVVNASSLSADVRSEISVAEYNGLVYQVVTINVTNSGSSRVPVPSIDLRIPLDVADRLIQVKAKAGGRDLPVSIPEEGEVLTSLNASLGAGESLELRMTLAYYGLLNPLDGGVNFTFPVSLGLNLPISELSIEVYPPTGKFEVPEGFSLKTSEEGRKYLYLRSGGEGVGKLPSSLTLSINGTGIKALSGELLEEVFVKADGKLHVRDTLSLVGEGNEVVSSIVMYDHFLEDLKCSTPLRMKVDFKMEAGQYTINLPSQLKRGEKRTLVIEYDVKGEELDVSGFFIKEISGDVVLTQRYDLPLRVWKIEIFDPSGSLVDEREVPGIQAPGATTNVRIDFKLSVFSLYAPWIKLSIVLIFLACAFLAYGKYSSKRRKRQIKERVPELEEVAETIKRAAKELRRAREAVKRREKYKEVRREIEKVDRSFRSALRSLGSLLERMPEVYEDVKEVLREVEESFEEIEEVDGEFLSRKIKESEYLKERAVKEAILKGKLKDLLSRLGF